MARRLGRVPVRTKKRKRIPMIFHAFIKTQFHKNNPTFDRFTSEQLWLHPRMRKKCFGFQMKLREASTNAQHSAHASLGQSVNLKCSFLNLVLPRPTMTCFKIPSRHMHRPLAAMSKKMRQTITTITTLLTLVTFISFGQEQRTLKGVTIDGHRNPIIACNVIIKGTTTGTVTNDCGEFSIPIDTDEFTILFHGMSYDDMRTYEIKLKLKDFKDDINVFQLGHWKIKNEVCKKPVDKKLKRYVIE